ncbi:MAG: glycosyltransferase [Patescibacteria group bacterium]|nr:glycosyltransferase [Patescibacteria group bacterium]
MPEKKIKIIHIIPTLDLGGAEKLLVDIVKNLDKEKFESKVVCLKRFGFWGMELKREGIPLILAGGDKKLGLFVFLKLVKILKKEKPDIIHTHLFGADIFGRLAGRLAGVKVIVSTEHNLNYQESFLKKILKKSTAGLATSVIAVSRAVKDYAVKFEGADRNKTEIIYNGVEAKRFLNKNRDYHNEKKEIVVGSVGRLTKQKGFDGLITALAKTDKKVKCFIAGDGAERKRLEKLIKKLNLSGRVELAGWQKDVSEFLNSLDIFVLPSRWEGFGIAILEAGLAGLPVIASGVDGIKEIIEDGQDGLLFGKEDVSGLAEKINYLIERPRERERLGLNLQDKVKEKFAIEKIVKEYEDLYLRLLSEQDGLPN